MLVVAARIFPLKDISAVGGAPAGNIKAGIAVGNLGFNNIFSVACTYNLEFLAITAVVCPLIDICTVGAVPVVNIKCAVVSGTAGKNVIISVAVAYKLELLSVAAVITVLLDIGSVCGASPVNVKIQIAVYVLDIINTVKSYNSAVGVCIYIVGR